MFSLAKYQRPTFEMEIKEGVIIHMYPTTYARAQKMKEAESLDEKMLFELVAELISDNQEEYKVTADDLRLYSEDSLIMFLAAYHKFIRDIYKDPNLESPIAPGEIPMNTDMT